MKPASISDNAWKKMTDEIEELKLKGVVPPTIGSIIDEMVEKRYKGKK